MSADSKISDMLKNIDPVTGLQVGQTISNFVPGGTFVGAGLNLAESSVTAQRENVELHQTFGNIEQAAYYSPAVQRKLEELGCRPMNGLAQFGVSNGGAAVGGMLGTMIPVPYLGTIGGAWVGDQVASRLFDEAWHTQDQDALTIVSHIYQAKKSGEHVAPEVIFAALAGNLPADTGKLLEDRLEELTGTRQFHEAVAQGKTVELKTMMTEFQDVIRGDTGMPLDSNNPMKTPAEQYAELINSGEMDARALILNPARMPSLAALNKQATAPALPQGQEIIPSSIQRDELRQIAQSLHAAGKTLAYDKNGQAAVVPVEYTTPPRSRG